MNVRYSSADTLSLIFPFLPTATTDRLFKPPPPKKKKKKSYFFKLILRNAFRHRLRTLLTIIGITIAILAFGLLRTVVSAWYAGVEASSASRLVTRNAISLIFSLPISYREKMHTVPGGQAGLLRQLVRRGLYHRKNFFPQLCHRAENLTWNSIRNSSLTRTARRKSSS